METEKKEIKSPPNKGSGSNGSTADTGKFTLSTRLSLLVIKEAFIFDLEFRAIENFLVGQGYLRIIAAVARWIAASKQLRPNDI